MKKTPEEIIENNPILKTIIIDGNDEYRGGAIQQAIEKVMQEYATQCQQDNEERKPFWINLSEKKPNCYETGIWDGKRSGKIFLRDNNGYSFVGVCYQGTMDGSEYCNFYDDNDFDLDNITHWAEIPSLN